MSSGTGLWGGGTNALKEKEFFVSSLYSVCHEHETKKTNSITNGKCSLTFRTLPECSNYEIQQTNSKCIFASRAEIKVNTSGNRVTSLD